MACPEINRNVADLLFEPESAPAGIWKHVSECSDCAAELASLKATMEILEDWHVPEPGAFFDARLYARLRSEAASEPAGFFASLRARLLRSSQLHMRQWAAGTLAAVLTIGAGTFAVLDHGRQARQSSAVQASATVRDLQSYDGEVQLFQQLNALDGADGNPSGAAN